MALVVSEDCLIEITRMVPAIFGEREGKAFGDCAADGEA